jgi:excisionase family DNA binding protein
MMEQPRPQHVEGLPEPAGACREAPLRIEQMPDLLTVPEVAKWLRAVGRNGVYHLVHTGRIYGIRLGRRLLVPRRELERLLDPSEGAPTEDSPPLRVVAGGK